MHYFNNFSLQLHGLNKKLCKLGEGDWIETANHVLILVRHTRQGVDMAGRALRRFRDLD